MGPSASHLPHFQPRRSSEAGAPGSYLLAATRKEKQFPCLLSSFCYASQKSNSHPKERRPLYPTGGVGRLCREAGGAGSVGKRGASSNWKNPRTPLRTLAHHRSRHRATLRREISKQLGKTKERRTRSERCCPAGTAHGSPCPSDSPARRTPETPPWPTGVGDKGTLRGRLPRGDQGSGRPGLCAAGGKTIICLRA